MMQQAEMQHGVALEQRVGWDDLRLLLAVIQEDGVRGAAERLGVHASTVSRRLAALEEALGAKLFERHPTGLELTSAGEEARDFGVYLEEELRDLCVRLARHDTELSGVLRVTAAEVVASTTTRLIGAFALAHPKISVELRISDAMASLERHEVDVAIRVADEPGESLVGRRVGRSQAGLFASRQYVARRGRDLCDETHSFVEWPRAVQHKPAFRWLEARLPRRSQVVRANSASAVLTCVRAGIGIAPLGLDQGSAEADLVLLERLPPDCATNVWLLTHKDLRATARVRALLDYLSSRLPTELDVGERIPG